MIGLALLAAGDTLACTGAGPPIDFWRFSRTGTTPHDKDAIAFAAVVIEAHGKPDVAIEVPREKVIWDRVHPTGRGVIFISESEWGQ